MNRARVVGFAVMLAIAGALASGSGRDAAAGEGRKEKVRRLAEKLGYPEWLREIVRRHYAAEKPDDSAKVEERLKAVKWDALLSWVVDELDKRVDDATLDEVLPYLDTAEGKRHLALVRLERSLAEVDLVLAVVPTLGRNMNELMEGFTKVLEEATGGEMRNPLQAAKESSNETAAIATLWNLCVCQAMMQTTGKIDCDADGIGEYGTFLELTGSVGVRKAFYPGDGGPAGTDFVTKGTPVNPAIVSASLANVDADGIVTKSGYCFRIYLPDTAGVSGCVHETGPAAQVGLAGGTGKVGVDLCEVVWCAYAWPVERGVSGNRAFFVNQSADVLQSANDVAEWSGPQKAPPGNSAFRADGITGMIAVGTAGRDGDVWKVTN